MTSESAERAYCEIQPQLESAGRVRDVPYQFIQKSGTVIEVLLDCLVTTDPAGQRIGLTVVRNVTAQREAERRVRLQSAALEAAANAIVITNRFGRVSWANSAFARLTGYAVDEIVGQTMRLLKSNQQDAAFYKNLWDTIQAGQVWRGELVNRRKDGSLYVEEQTITPVRDERGDIVYFVGIKQDITERKRIEEALRASEQRFRSLVESADDIIAMQDPADGRYLFIHVPPRYGIAEAELVGRQPGQIIAPEMAQQFVEMVRRVAREGQAQMIERDITLGGRRIYLQTTFSPIVDEQGRVAAVLSISRDITIQRQMQVKMMHADRLSAVGKLAASVAHEINNPLQSVIGCLGLAQEALDEQSEDPREYLRVAREEVLRIKRIVARMRDLYRPESGEKKPTDVNALVEQVLDVSRKRCQESGVEVEWAPAADMPRLTVAPDQIKQVFLNLLLNAIDAMPGGGKLRVATTYQTVEPAGVVIRFSDSGVGIPSDIKPHIFETFYSTKPEGSGLGLSISYNIIEQHGGRLDVDSREGEGSTFSVWLPV
jgi:PAS domain S-box-containing protein